MLTTRVLNIKIWPDKTFKPHLYVQQTTIEQYELYVFFLSYLDKWGHHQETPALLDESGYSICLDNLWQLHYHVWLG